MLTLEIQQIKPKGRHEVTEDDVLSLQTHWRVTDFDLNRMRVVFQLEEKLGLEMAERRRQEILQQHQKLSSSKSITTPMDHSSSTSLELPRLRRRRASQDDIEARIWQSRRRSLMNRQSPASTDATAMDLGFSDLDTDLADGNFFHCNSNDSVPCLRSATVSFKAHRNVPASWIKQRIEHSGSCPSFLDTQAVSSSSSSTPVTPTQTESHPVRSARERIAAFQQNKVLLRSLANMRHETESNSVQFLPTVVELDTQDLGQKKVEALILSRCPPSGHLSVQVNGSMSLPQTFSLMVHQHGQLTKGFSKALKHALKRSSWNGTRSSPMGYPSMNRHRSQIRRSLDGSTRPLVLSRAKSWNECPCSGKTLMAITTTPCSEREHSNCALKRKSSFGAADGSRHGRRRLGAAEDIMSDGEDQDDDGEEEEVHSDAVDEHQLFELTYGVRHNYIHTNRLEGERVIRPIRTSVLEEEALAIVSIYGPSSFYAAPGNNFAATADRSSKSRSATAAVTASSPVYTLRVSLEEPDFDYDPTSIECHQTNNNTGDISQRNRSKKELELCIYFPRDYPDTENAPVHEIVSIYYGAQRLTDDMIQEINHGLDQCFVPGEVVVFSWIEWLRTYLEDLETRIQEENLADKDKDHHHHHLHDRSKDGRQDTGTNEEGDEGDDSEDRDHVDDDDDEEEEGEASEGQRATSDYFAADGASHDSTAISSSLASLSLHPPASDTHSPRVSGRPILHIHTGAPIVDRKSVFVAHLAAITQPGEVPWMLEQLKQENKKVIKATHNIMAFRVENPNGSIAQDNDDDGETAAGSRLLHLMSILDVKNVVVVVSRWYGGIPLSADRFKHINNAARQLLDECGYIQGASSVDAAASSGTNKKKGKGKGKKSGKK
ncbi:hypothetical protein BG011_005615 [Mortierella polycephala]|uniref:RWD domain-containing protein n=1 Tax=Mortierella polycephala TaxID=41804 RepID=A0A9P6U131_9FUNG|nr:hypothetical protein BG011_005615 [Mortierella polycephala]